MNGRRILIPLVLAAWTALSPLPSSAAAIRVVDARPGRTRLLCEVDGYRLTVRKVGGRPCAVVRAGGMHLLKRRGFPELPWAQARVALPPGATPRIRILATEVEEIDAPPPLPSAGFASRSGPRPPRVFGPFYGLPVAFPPRRAVAGKPYRIRDVRGTAVTFFPFAYDPVRRKLRVYRRIEAEVVAEEGQRPRRRGRRRRSREFDRILRGSFVNHTSEAGDTSGRDSVSGQLTEDGVLLVIGPEELLAGMGDFIEWKRQRGLSVTVKRYPADTGGGTDSAALHGFLKTQYTETDLDFVVLVGDAEDVPYVGGGEPGDPMYACLSGTEEPPKVDDYYHDVLISRISVSSPEDVAEQAGRFVTYEREPLAAGDTAWYLRGLMIASDEGASKSAFDMDDDELLHDESEKWLAYGFTDVDEEYEPDTTTSAITASINAGKSLLFYLGHGSEKTSPSWDSYWNTGHFGIDEASALENGMMLPFVVSGACHVGDFIQTHGDCLAEAWMKAGTDDSPAGSIGFIGSTTAMDWDPPIVMEQAFTQLLSAGEVRTAGGLAFAAIQEAMDYCYATKDEGAVAAKKIMQQTHLFGDCTLGLRVKEPRALNVTHDDFVEPLVDFPVTVSVQGQPLADATVCLYREGDVQEVGKTDSLGSVVLSSDPPEGDPLALTVYHPDHVPYQTEVPIAVGHLRVVSAAALPSGFVGESYTFEHRAAGGTPPYTWSVTTPDTFPAEWLGLDPGTGTISGTPPEAASYSYSIQVEDAEARGTTQQQVTLTVGQAVQITTVSLPGGTVEERYGRQTIQASGSFPPFSFAVTAGALPSGLVLTSTGDLGGKPTISGAYEFSVTAEDGVGKTDSQALTLVVAPSSTISVTTPAALPDGDRGIEYPELLLQAKGGTGSGYSWEEAVGALPPGLYLNRSGAIAGTPTAGGEFAVTILVEDDHDPPHTATRAFTIKINTPVYFESGVLPEARHWEPYQAALPVVGTYGPLQLSCVPDVRGYGTATAASSFGADGVRQPWDEDEQEWDMDLGFSFPLWGEVYTSVRVGDNGYLVLGSGLGPGDGPAADDWEMYFASADHLRQRVMIAPFWNDLVIPDFDDLGAGIYVAQGRGDITIRWRGVDYEHMDPEDQPEQWVSEFSVTLSDTGDVTFRYGTIHTDNRWVIGFSDGTGDAVVVYDQPEKHQPGPDGTDVPGWDYPDDLVFTARTGLEWLSLHPDGSLSGTPTDVGTFGLTAFAQDAEDYTATQRFDIVVRPGVKVDLDPDQGSPTSDPTVHFRVTFSGPVTGFDEDDIVLGGTALPSSVAVGGGPAAYDVAVSGMQQDGTVSILFGEGAGLHEDESLTPPPAIVDNEAVYDLTRPSAEIGLAPGQADPTDGTPVRFQVVFDEDVAGFTGDDVVVGGSAGFANALVTGGPRTFVLEAQGEATDGTVTVWFDANAALDRAGNGCLPPDVVDGTVRIDVTPPTAEVTLAPGQPSVTSQIPITFVVDFSEDVTGFTPDDVTPLGAADGGTVGVSGAGSQYTVAVAGLTQDGLASIWFDAGVAVDAAGNGNVAPVLSGNSVLYDSKPPSASIDLAEGQTDPAVGTAVGTTVVFAVTFDENVFGFDGNDVLPGGSGEPAAVTVEGGPREFQVEVSGMLYSGTVNVTFGAGAASDLAGWGNTGPDILDNEVVVTLTRSVELELVEGWNCVSLPIEPANPSPRAVFPSCVGPVWCWNPLTQSFEAEAVIRAKVGYWIQWDSPRDTCRVDGYVVSDPVFQLARGWNLLGPVADRDVPQRDAIQQPVWGWKSTGYGKAARLEVLSAYWVYARQPDVINLRGD